MSVNFDFATAAGPVPGGAADFAFGGFVLPDPVAVTGLSVLGGVGGFGLALYDNRNPRRVTVSAEMPHQPAEAGAAAAALGWGLSAQQIQPTAAPWGRATPARRETPAGWGISGRVASDRSAPWVLGAGRAKQASFTHQVARSLRQQIAAPWGLAGC